MTTPSSTRESDAASVGAVASAPDRPHRFRKGDEAGFLIFVETNCAHLNRFAWIRLGLDEQAAQEVVQATLAEALRNLNVLHSRAHAGVSVLMWLFRLCRLEIKEYLHRRERQTHTRARAQSSFKLKDAIVGLAGKGDDVASLCLDESLRHLVVVIFDRLPEREAAALELKYLGGSSDHEVARLLDLTVPASEALLTQARAAFRAELKRLANVSRP